MRAMLLHYAGEAVFELSETVVVTEYYDNFAQKLNGSSLLASGRQTQCSEEYEIFKFRGDPKTRSAALRSALRTVFSPLTRILKRGPRKFHGPIVPG